MGHYAKTIREKATSKNLAKELDIPVIAVSQLNREVEKNSGGDCYFEVLNFDREQPGLYKRAKSDYPDPSESSGGSGNFPEEQNLTPTNPRELNLRDPNRNEPNTHRIQPRLTPQCRRCRRCCSRSTGPRTNACRRCWSSVQNASRSNGNACSPSDPGGPVRCN